MCFGLLLRCRYCYHATRRQNITDDWWLMMEKSVHHLWWMIPYYAVIAACNIAMLDVRCSLVFSRHVLVPVLDELIMTRWTITNLSFYIMNDISRGAFNQHIKSSAFVYQSFYKQLALAWNLDAVRKIQNGILTRFLAYQLFNSQKVTTT